MSLVKPHRIRQHQKAEKTQKIQSEELLKEFKDFKNGKKDTVDWKVVPEPLESGAAKNDSQTEEKIIDELHQLITPEYKEVSPLHSTIFNHMQYISDFDFYHTFLLKIYS